jgi:hypothetical protein
MFTAGNEVRLEVGRDTGGRHSQRPVAQLVVLDGLLRPRVPHTADADVARADEAAHGLIPPKNWKKY